MSDYSWQGGGMHDQGVWHIEIMRDYTVVTLQCSSVVMLLFHNNTSTSALFLLMPATPAASCL